MVLHPWVQGWCAISVWEVRGQKECVLSQPSSVFSSCGNVPPCSPHRLWALPQSRVHTGGRRRAHSYHNVGTAWSAVQGDRVASTAWKPKRAVEASLLLIGSWPVLEKCLHMACTLPDT